MKKLYHFAPMAVATLLMALMIAVFEALTYTSQVLLMPDIYIDVMAEYDVDDALYQGVDDYFAMYSRPTGIPKETFTDPLKQKELSSSSLRLVQDSIRYLAGRTDEKPEVKFDFTGLENSITDYVESYAEANNKEKDADYEKLIKNTIRIAEEQVRNRIDVMLMKKLCSSGFAQAIRKLAKYLVPAMIASGCVIILLIAVMVFIDRHHIADLPYWFGTAMFSSSLLFLIPCLILKHGRKFDGFFISDAGVYRTVTGLLYTITGDLITINGILLTVGVMLILFAQLIHLLRKKKAIKENESETDD